MKINYTRGSGAEPEAPMVASCRSHFGQLYLAYAIVGEVAHMDGVGYDSIGFNTVFDGGAGLAWENEMWHVFAYFKSGEDSSQPGAPLWVVLKGGHVAVFRMDLPIRETRSWPRVSLGRLWELLNQRLSKIEAVEVSNRFFPRQLKHVAKFEEEFFARWGQGGGPMFGPGTRVLPGPGGKPKRYSEWLEWAIDHGLEG